MIETNELQPNTFFIEVSGSGLPEVDGLFVPSTGPPAKSESGTESSLGYWNGKMPRSQLLHRHIQAELKRQ